MDNIEKMAASTLWLIMVVTFTVGFFAMIVLGGPVMKRAMMLCLFLSLVSSSGALVGGANMMASGVSSLPAGQYVAMVYPRPDQETASGILDALQDVPGVDGATLFIDTSMLQITVGRSVEVGNLNQALRDVDSNLRMTPPQQVLR